MANSTDQSASILVVEDNADIRDALQELLEDLGYRVAAAVHGLEALEYLRRSPTPRLILLDLMMPVMDGLQLRAELAKEPALAAIPVVMITAHPRAAGLEGMEVLSKPIDMDKLLKALDRYVPAA